ncbi:MAG TPA: hypothetical protein VGF45_23140 [Polyangia bacterium]
MAEDSRTLDTDDAVRKLELEVARRRDRLMVTLQNLRSEIQEVSDWRHWYAKQPVAFLAGAAALGWLIGMAVPSSGHRRF